jgi:pimeloyl-ACP methyl ester carboxylesterase
MAMRFGSWNTSLMHVTVAFLVLLSVAAARAQAPQTITADDPYAPGRAVVAELQRIVTPRGIQENFVVPLGGARQQVYVRGADKANPIILFLHGGPGATEMAHAWTFQRPWEDFFTVVHYDQRGAGKSYPLNDPSALTQTMTIGRYRDDAIELIELLCKKYEKRKVILMGLSWGSQLGIEVARKRPDLLFAYVGVGQAIDTREGERVGFQWTLDRARAESNVEAIKELEALEPYPGAGPLDIKRTDAERKWSIHYGALVANRKDADAYFHAPRLSPEHTPADRKAMNDGSLFTVTTLWPRLTNWSVMNVRKMNVPILFFLGRHDYTVPAVIADKWLKRLAAPIKKTVWFEHSAHLPMFEEPGRVFAALLQHVRPLAHASRAAKE